MDASDPLSLNLYAYCCNNPVMYVDPSGHIVTEWDKLNCTKQEILQIQNATRDWYEAKEKGDAAAMIRAHESATEIRSRHLNSVETVKADGHISIRLTQKDIDCGVSVVTIDGDQYMDVTNAVYTAFKSYEDEFSMFENSILKAAYFISIVNHNKAWDIKRKMPWEETISTTFPGSYAKPVVFNGAIVTPEILGNVTYGYIGARLGFGATTLAIGSYAAAKFPLWGEKLKSEMIDEVYVRIGYNLYWGV